MPHSEYKNYLLGLIFYKYLSDKQQILYEKLLTDLFHVLATEAKQMNDLETVLLDLSSNYEQFNGLFEDVDLQSKKLGADEQQWNITITEVLKKLDVVDALGHNGDVIGDAYEYLIDLFAPEAGKKQ